MLSLTLVASEEKGYDEEEIHMEHSLVSLSKWEAEHEKAFYGREEKKPQEIARYLEHMLVSPLQQGDLIDRMTVEQVRAATDYINSKQTATWFADDNTPGANSKETITSELIYYWMIQFKVPIQGENWHINRLLTLIKICGVKQTKPKKMSQKSVAEQYRKLSAERRDQLGTNG